jgi:5-hydroxyisourate hydrolase
MSRLSTHVLDTSRGKPAAGIPVRLYQAGRLVCSQVTDVDGRCQDLLPAGFSLEPGVYRIVFDVIAYFPEGLYPEITIAFKVIAGTTHYHIPLLLSPFGFTTYRGS